MKTIDPNALIRSENLSHLIHQEIKTHGGQIPFARFMELALYAPGLGYYSAGTTPFGHSGDFITAPHISPLFSHCLAQQFSLLLPDLKNILEIGAGSGVFAKDVLQKLEKMGNLPENYYIFEISPILCESQKLLFQQECPHLLSRIHWLEELPDHFTGIIFANEVLDALPIHCFQAEEDGIKERCVGFENNQLCWQLAEPSKAMLGRLNLNELSLPVGYQSELNLGIPNWLQAISSSLDKGVVFLFDYGYGRREYYHPDRTQGTLMCFYQHQKHADPFLHIGLQDITAHVDFTAVVECAMDVGFSLAGYTTQASFLLACGLLELEQQTDIVDQYQQNQAIKKLTLPSQMGEVIKVMGLTKDFDMPLLGFSLHDRRRDL